MADFDTFTCEIDDCLHHPASAILPENPLDFLSLTLTLDNGKEFSHHQQIDQSFGLQTYFADPYCSWQRGSNENFNGLLRQYVPKKRALSTVTQEELTMIENRLNHRPRKQLGFKTPTKCFMLR